MKNNNLRKLSHPGLLLLGITSGLVFIANKFESKYYFLIFLIVSLIIIYFYNKYNNEYSDKYIKNMNEFKGFGKIDSTVDTVESHDIFDVNRDTNSHVVIIGATDTGKTHFIRHQLRNTTEPVLILCNYADDWGDLKDKQNIKIESLSTKGLNERNATVIPNLYNELKDKIVIIDDAGTTDKANGNLNVKTLIDKILTQGRHDKIQLVFMAHYPKDVAPKTRMNVNTVIIPRKNNESLFKSTAEVYSLPKGISSHRNPAGGVVIRSILARKTIILDELYNVIPENEVVNSEYEKLVKMMNADCVTNFNNRKLITEKMNFILRENKIYKEDQVNLFTFPFYYNELRKDLKLKEEKLKIKFDINALFKIGCDSTSWRELIKDNGVFSQPVAQAISQS